MSAPTVVEAARRKLAAGDATAALALLEPEIARTGASDDARILAARACRALARHADAAALLEVASANAPGNGVVAHNLASALGDAGQHGRAISAARRAIALRDAPESWLVLGKALQTLGDLSGGREALEQAVARRPGYVDALKLLSQLIWMTTGDAEAALTPLSRALNATPSAELAAMTCGVMKTAAGPDAALAFIEKWTGRGSVMVELAAAAAAERVDRARHLAHATAAADLAPDHPDARHAGWTARLGVGDASAVYGEIETWLATHPRDQVALGLRSAASRLANHPSALTAADYERLVRTYDIVPPPGWSDRPAWLDDLAAALRRLHSFRAEPFGQSVRAGAQSRTDPRWVEDPVIDATFGRIEEAIADYVSRIDPDGPMGAQNTGAAVISGSWSVRLTAGGWHSDHIHPQGWLSSAFYVSLPEPTPAEPFGGWLRFGAAQLGPDLELPAEHRVEPRPGRLALFPSFLWHGTEPFSGAGERLTLAFDAIPA